MGRIRRPGGGRKTKEEAERLALIERKKVMAEKFMEKSEELIDKNPAEARQCMAEARTLFAEIESLKTPKEEDKPAEKEPEKEKEEIDEDGSNTFKIMEFDDDNPHDEGRFPPQHWDRERQRWVLDEEEKPSRVLRRRKTA